MNFLSFSQIHDPLLGQLTTTELQRNTFIFLDQINLCFALINGLQQLARPDYFFQVVSFLAENSQIPIVIESDHSIVGENEL